VISLLVALALAPVDVAAQPEAGAPPPAAAAAAPAKPKAKGSDRICWEEMPTGSHYPKRYCATRDELETRAQRDQDALNQKGRNPGAGSGFKSN
jgi:hypothetical protein